MITVFPNAWENLRQVSVSVALKHSKQSLKTEISAKVKSLLTADLEALLTLYTACFLLYLYFSHVDSCLLLSSI